MPVIVTTVNTRLTLVTNFQTLPESAIQHIKTQYQDTGKLLDIQTSFSDDHLTRTTTLTFSSPEATHEYNSDATLYEAFNATRIYNSANGITFHRTIVNA